MTRPRNESRKQRQARFEQFEQRLVMSAQAVASILPELELASPAMTAQVISHPLLENANDSSGQGINGLSQPSGDHDFDGEGQTIAVIDSGIAWDHYALGGGFGAGKKVVGGWDFAENDANPYDDGPAGYHGTHVGGIIGSEDSQYKGVASGADLVALRVFDDQGGGDLKWVEQALQWVHDHRNDFENPITTVNLSLGTNWNGFNTPEWATLEEEFAQLETDGLFISVAAGNSFKSFNQAGLSYPAVSSHVVPVASHDADGQLSDFSQRAEGVLAAPGEGIVSTAPDHLFGNLQHGRFIGSTGTSMAAPYVAGASAVLRQANESLGVTDIDQDMLYEQFRETADKIYDSVTKGYYYRINLKAAIDAVVAGAGNGHTAQETDTPDAVVLKSGVLTINGTEQNDSISVDTNNGFSVSVNGVDYQFTASQVQSIRIDGAGGRDTLDLNLGGTNDRVSTRPDSIYVRNDQFKIDAIGLETVSVAAGSGRNSIALGGSEGADTFSSTPETATLHGAGYSTTANGFDSVYVLSSGGNDTANLTGTSGDDFLASRNGRHTLRAGGSVVVADQFSVTNVYGKGGDDQANLFGTEGGDRFVLRPTYAYVASESAHLRSFGFETINAIEGRGNDSVDLHDSIRDDRFVFNDGTATMSGSGFLNRAHGFQAITVHAGSGYDVAHLVDTQFNDTFTTGRDGTVLKSSGLVVATHGFDRVNAVAVNGGVDTAIMVGSEGADVLQADAKSVTVTDDQGTIRRAVGFENAHVDLQGGVDRSYLTGSAAAERLTASYSDIEFETTLQMLQLKNSEHTAFKGNGGHDEVAFEGFSEVDLLESIGDKATAYFNDHSVSAEDFSLLEAKTVDDAIADYDLEAVDYLYMLRGQWNKKS